jgi:DNA-binding MarR family transcriptional regulator
LEEEVFIGLCLAAQMLEQPWNRYLRSSAGLNITQYNMLRILRGAGLEGATIGDITVRLIHRYTNVRAMIDELVQKRLVAKKRASTNWRLTNFSITQEGLDVLAGLDEAARMMPRKMLEHLDDKHLYQLDELLGSVLKGDLHFP